MKIYKRDGRRFVEIQDHTGMYLQDDWTFAKERNEHSIGICVLQTMTSTKVALFAEYKGSWESCKRFCESIQAHMGTREELFIASKFIRNGVIKGDKYWTSDEVNHEFSWLINLRRPPYNFFGACGDNYKGYDASVLAFVDIPL